MTPAELETKLKKLIKYVTQLAEQHNALEQKVAELDAKIVSLDLRGLKQ
jgi:hypothetical protein